MTIKAKCRKCGKEVPVEEFVLDNAYKMMVCKNCSKERYKRESSFTNKELKREKPKPAGWDHEDEYLERAYRAKQSGSIGATKIDDERVKYICPKCKFSFAYNTVTKRPPKCPFCNSQIAKIMVF